MLPLFSFLQAVADGQVGNQQQEVPAIAVLRLPKDEHAHHEGLAGAGSELEGDPRYAVAVFLVELPERLHESFPLTVVGLLQVDRGLDGVPLAEVGLHTLPFGLFPVLDQFDGLVGRARIARLAPGLHGFPDPVDPLVRLHLLTGLLLVAQGQLGLAPGGLGNRQVSAAGASARQGRGDGPEVDVQAPVPLRRVVWLVEDRRLDWIARRPDLAHIPLPRFPTRTGPAGCNRPLADGST